MSALIGIVAEVARQKGVDPVTTVACMLVESGGSNAATGDNGTSFGLLTGLKHRMNDSEGEVNQPSLCAGPARARY